MERASKQTWEVKEKVVCGGACITGKQFGVGHLYYFSLLIFFI